MRGIARALARAPWLIALLLSASIPQSMAHTTLGHYDGIPPLLRSDDHELNPRNSFGRAHVPGPLAHLWPGAGQGLYLGEPLLPPGYQSPFATFERPFQAGGCSYSPEGGIMASGPRWDSIGDFILAINFSQPSFFANPSNPSPVFRYWNLTIYIPAPVVGKGGELIQDGFEPAGAIRWDLGDSSNIVTTLTDDYGRIFVSKADELDPFGPGWWVIRIEASGRGMEFTPERGWGEWYYVRINQIRAPVVAGRYFFKIFLGDRYPIASQSASAPIRAAMPAENWPVVLVKADPDPAIIHGTVRYGKGAAPGLYGEPIHLAGKVRAVGLAEDPISGRVTDRPVEARAYFNASSQGRFELEGLAPGLYDIYASAAGFPEQKVAEGVRVHRGQSLSLDVHLSPGPQLYGIVRSEGAMGSMPWSSQSPITVVIYDSDHYAERNAVCQSPINLTHAPYIPHVHGNVVFGPSGLAPPNSPKPIAFPWEGPGGYNPYSAAPPHKDPFGLFNGVGPAQKWWVGPGEAPDPITGLGSDRFEFRFQFGAKGYFGIPRRLSGMVPQVFATWIDGLGPGNYFVRAFVNGYVQTDASGTRFKHSYFTIPEGAFGFDLSVHISLRRSGIINVTIHFHDRPGEASDSPIGGPDPHRFILVEALDYDGSLAAFNFTHVPSSASSITVTLNGLGMAGPTSPLDPRRGIKNSLLRYRGIRDYGLYPGPYMIRAYARGYIQAAFPGADPQSLDQPLQAQAGMYGSVSQASLHMYRGAGLNVTIRSLDSQRPAVERPWVWNASRVAILAYDAASRAFADVIYFWNPSANSWSLPITNSAHSTIPWPGWRGAFGPSASALITNGSVLVDRMGPDLPSPPIPALEPSSRTNLFLQAQLRLGFLYSESYYRGRGFKSSLALYPGQYAISAWTYGYVQEGVAALGDLGERIVSASMGSISDVGVELVRGVEFNLTILFRREGVFAALPFNASMRIRIYDDRDILVAAASTSNDPGGYFGAGCGFFADGTKVAFAGCSVPPIPAGAKRVEYLRLAGLFGYVDPSLGGERRRAAMLFQADQGVWGKARAPMAGSYGGGWTVVIELTNWYRPSGFHPPAPGLLQGELHLTNLTALLPYNHLGPFGLRHRARIEGAHLGSGASLTIVLDERAYISGSVYGFNWKGLPRTASWAAISIESIGAGGFKHQAYTFDGFFDSYAEPGPLALTVSARGYCLGRAMIHATEGSSTRLEFYLEPG
ncbi:MAG: carboxypeptidase-like regulatory domain-containing protein [Candidatus Bathyarchaeia archaeon]